MSYLDNLESSLKNLETNQERGEDLKRDVQHRASEKARALAAADLDRFRLQLGVDPG